MTPSSRIGRGSPASTAARTRATASAWASVQSAPAGRVPRSPGGRAASGRRGRSRTSTSTRPRRTRREDRRAPVAVAERGRGDARRTRLGRSRGAAPPGRRLWRGPSGRPVVSPGDAADASALRGQPDPPLVARSDPGRRAASSRASRGRGPPAPGSGGADPPGPRPRPGRGPAAAVAPAGRAGRGRRASGRPARAVVVRSASSSSRSRKPGGSIERTTTAGGAR